MTRLDCWVPNDKWDFFNNILYILVVALKHSDILPRILKTSTSSFRDYTNGDEKNRTKTPTYENVM